jgi:hypothetical protein
MMSIAFAYAPSWVATTRGVAQSRDRNIPGSDRALTCRYDPYTRDRFESSSRPTTQGGTKQ